MLSLNPLITQLLPQLDALRTRVDQCMLRDRHRARARLRAITSEVERASSSTGTSTAMTQAATDAQAVIDAQAAIDAFAQRVDASVAERAARLKNLPVPTFPE